MPVEEEEARRQMRAQLQETFRQNAALSQDVAAKEDDRRDATWRNKAVRAQLAVLDREDETEAHAAAQATADVRPHE